MKMKTPEIGKGMRKMKNEREKTKIRKRERESSKRTTYLPTENVPPNGNAGRESGREKKREWGRETEGYHITIRNRKIDIVMYVIRRGVYSLGSGGHHLS